MKHHFWKVGGQTSGASPFIIAASSYKWRTQDLEHVHSSEYCTCCAFFPARCAKRSSLRLQRAALTGWAAVFASVGRDGTQSSAQTDVTFFGGTFVKDVVCPRLTICHRLFDLIVRHIFHWRSWPQNSHRKTSYDYMIYCLFEFIFLKIIFSGKIKVKKKHYLDWEIRFLEYNSEV